MSIRSFLLTLAACSCLSGLRSEETLIRSVPLAKSEPVPGATTLFKELLPAESGVTFQNSIHPKQGMPDVVWNGAGVAVGDFDKDGQPDIFLVSESGEHKLFRQTAPFKFEDVTAKAGIRIAARHGIGAAWADINNDGWLDLYVCNWGMPNECYINQKDGTFKECAKELGLDFFGGSVMACFGDFDRDGRLDVYILTNSNPVLIRNGRTGDRDALFHQNADGTFTDVSIKAGIAGNDLGNGAIWWDFNNDGWPDLYVANDYETPDHLYRNNRDGTFTDVAEFMLPCTTWNSMGCDFADLTHDGRQDLFVSEMSATTHFKQKVQMGQMNNAKLWPAVNAKPPQYMRNMLFKNTGTNRFEEAAYMAGVDSTDWTWAAKFCDLDNDGWTDLYVTTGMGLNFNDSDRLKEFKGIMQRGDIATAQKYFEEWPALKEECLAFKNKGDLKFENVSKSWGLNFTGVTHGAAWADFDHDGNMDLVVNRFNEPAAVYRNLGVKKDANSILIALEGTKSNKFGLGARVEIETDSGKQSSYLTPARGYASSDEPILHFGLGKDIRVKALRITWPSGVIQCFWGLEANRFYTIQEAAESIVEEKTVKTPPIFSDANAVTKLNFVHKETDFNDYERQPLLPWKHSQLGPGICWGDVNGDGFDDVFVGGASMQPGALYINKGDGTFEKQEKIPWAVDLASAGMGCVFFDADGNGTLDLFVASGGVQADVNAPMFRPHLYLNDGKGNFVAAPVDSLPILNDSSSAACVADFTGDGKLDIFLGGRVVPGQYPLSPKSHLLKNDGKGKFTDVTAEFAPELTTVGMVSGAVAIDVDGDGKTDLLLALEFGPLTFFHNENGKLVNRTKGWGLEGTNGWWNGIAAGDLNGDGKPDFVATNYGLNTKYHASTDHPALVYYGDMDGSGKSNIVEAKLQDHTLLPVRGLGCSSQAMPVIRKNFPTYKEFGLATLEDIYSKDRLEKAKKFSVMELQSVALENTGTKFVIHALPRRAQIAPAYGVVIADLEGTGKPNIVLAENTYSPQIETGRMSGGLGLVLRNKGNFEFEAVEPAVSGIVVPEDAKALSVVDLNHDGWPDLVFTTNNGPLRVFTNKKNDKAMSYTVRLKKADSIGAKVVAEFEDGTKQTQWITGGAGYISQSSSDCFFFSAGKNNPKKATITWRDGKTEEVKFELGSERRRIE